MAAKRKSAADDQSSVRFVVAPPLQWIFGAATKGELDSERGLVEYALRFINGEESVVEPDPAVASGHPVLQGLLDEEALATKRSDYRASMRKFVLASRSNRLAALRSVPEHLLASSQVSMMPEWQPAVRLKFWVPVDSPDAFQALFAMTLADDSRGFGRALCRCRLKDCGRFFLEQKPAVGRPQRLYCSRKHMLAAHAARER